MILYHNLPVVEGLDKYILNLYHLAWLGELWRAEKIWHADTNEKPPVRSCVKYWQRVIYAGESKYQMLYQLVWSGWLCWGHKGENPH